MFRSIFFLHIQNFLYEHMLACAGSGGGTTYTNWGAVSSMLRQKVSIFNGTL